MPSVNKLYTELKGRGLEVRLISFREDPELVGRTARERGYAAPVLIDRRGQLVARIIGGRDWTSPGARKLLLDLLAQPGP